MVLQINTLDARMPFYDIKCRKTWQYGYQKNQFHQTNWSKFDGKCKENEIATIPLYF